VITDDGPLLDDLLGIAAYAGVDLDVAPDAAAARQRYTVAPFVVMTAGSALVCANSGFPRRPGVVLVARDATEAENEGERDVAWRAATAIGAEHVAFLPSARPWLEDRFADAAGSISGQPRSVGGSRPAASGVSADARVVATLGGRGGAGASVLAAGLAVTAARAGLRAMLVDADPMGGGVDLVLGWESLDGLRWPALSETSGPVRPPALVDALPHRGDLAVLSWDRSGPLAVPAPAMETALSAGRRGRDLVVVDLPRRLDEAAAHALATADLALMVVPAELRACAAAAKVAEAASAYTDALSVIVRLPSPGRLRVKEIGRALGIPVYGTLRPEPALSRGMERGEPPAGTGRGPLAALCRQVLAGLGLIERTAA
jgi:secretion/DNA translocation related CpaE-like protein